MIWIWPVINYVFGCQPCLVKKVTECDFVKLNSENVQCVGLRYWWIHSFDYIFTIKSINIGFLSSIIPCSITILFSEPQGTFTILCPLIIRIIFQHFNVWIFAWNQKFIFCQVPRFVKLFLAPISSQHQALIVFQHALLNKLQLQTRIALGSEQ